MAAIVLWVSASLCSGLAQAQSPTTYLANLTGTGNFGFFAFVHTFSSSVRSFAQGFNTGDHAGGYILDSVQLYFPATPGSLNVQIREDNSDAPGDTVLFQMTSPNSIAGSTAVTFSAPEGATLSSDTKYHVVVLVTESTSRSGQMRVRTGTNPRLETAPTGGWEFEFDGEMYWKSSASAAWADNFGENHLALRILGMKAIDVPTIRGTAQIGEDLTADTSTIADTDGVNTATYTYQWLREDADGMNQVPIEGETDAIYTLVLADEGKKIRVRVSFTDDGSNAETRTSDAYPETGTVMRRDDIPPTGSLGIMGVPNVGETLTATVGTLMDGNGFDEANFMYQWSRELEIGMVSTEDIDGATMKSYVLTDADLDHILIVCVSYTDNDGYPEKACSREFPELGSIDPAFGAGLPRISGRHRPRVDDTLTAVTSTVSDPQGVTAATAYTYQWLREDADGANQAVISGAASASYTLVKADEGKKIRVRVSFTDDADNDEIRASDAYPLGEVVRRRISYDATGEPQVTGIARVGRTLTATVGTIMDRNGFSEEEVEVTYSWDRYLQNGDIVTITGEEASTYTLTDDDLGLRVAVALEYTDLDGYPEAVFGSPFPFPGFIAAQASNTAASGEVTIDDGSSAQIGVQLSAVTTGIVDTVNGLNTPNWRYKWERADDTSETNPREIVGATSADYTPVRADQDKFLRVEVMFRDDDGHMETKISSWTRAVAKPADTRATGEVTVDDGTAAQVSVALVAVTTGIEDLVNGLATPNWSYRWERADDAAGTTGLTDVGTDSEEYTPQEADIGKFLRVEVMFTDDDGYMEIKTSDWTSAVVEAPITTDTEATGDVTIDDGSMAQVGVQLSAVTTGIADPVNGLNMPNWRYQWERADDRAGASLVDVVGATSADYTPVKEDEAKFLRVEVTFTDDDGHTETKTSDWTRAVARRDDTPATGLVTINGGATARVNVQISATTSDIADPVNGLNMPNWRYQWERANDRAGASLVDVVGATSADYTPVKEDEAKFLRVEVTFTDDDGHTETKTSDWTRAVARRDDTPATGSVTIDGGASARVNVQISAITSDIADPVNGLNMPNWRYQWQRADDSAGTAGLVDVGTDSERYTPVDADEGKYLRVEVRFTDDDGYSGVKRSEWTAAVLPPPETPDTEATGEVTVQGGATAQVGVQLLADTRDIDDPANGLNTPNWRYQWERADDSAGTTGLVDVGADSASYTPVKADQGKYLRVEVTFTDDDGYRETKTSDWSRAVAKQDDAPALGDVTIDDGSTAQVNVELTAVTSAIADSVNGLTTPNWRYRWERADDVAGPAGLVVVGDDSANYTPVKADEGKFLRVEVAFTDDDGYRETKTSEWTRAVARRDDRQATGVVTIDDGAMAQVGVSLTAVTTGITDSVNGLTTPNWRYKWERADDAAGRTGLTDVGADSPDYTPIQADEGKYLRVEVTFTDDDGYPETTYSDWTSAVMPGGSTSSLFAIEGPSATFTEPAKGTAELEFTVTLFRSVEQASDSFTVDYEITGSASGDRDYIDQSSDQSLAFRAGVTEQAITLTVNSDIVAESAGETVTITLVRPSQGASLAANSSATVTIIEPSEQLGVLVEDPQYSQTDRTVHFDIRLFEPAPVDGIVEWRAVLVESGAAAAASSRSVDGRTAENCTLDGSCTGHAEFQRGNLTPTDTSFIDYDSDLPVGTVIWIQVKPFAAAQGSTLPANTDVAVRPTLRLAAGEAETVTGGWVVAGKVIVVEPEPPAALLHAVADVGRSVAVGIVDGIWRRVDARLSGSSGSWITLGGQTLDTRTLSNGDSAKAVREVASLFGLESTSPEESPIGLNGGFGGGVDDYRAWAGIPDQRRLASQTSFALPVGERIGTGTVAFWGEFYTSARESELDENSFVESDSTDMLVGLDVTVGGMTLLGIAVSQSSGESTYSDVSASIEDATTESSLMTFAPYVHRTTSSGNDFWGSAGIGSGTLTRSVNSEMVEADLSLRMAAVGARARVRTFSMSTLSLKADALTTQTDTEEATSESESVAELSTAASRARAALVWSGGGGRQAETDALKHRLELGARVDSGDAGDGAGMDIAAALRYAPVNRGLELSANASTLLFHSQSGFNDLGLGLSAVYDPGRKGRGASLSLEPTWNAPRTGIEEAMWNDRNLGGHFTSKSGTAMKARVGYGAAAFRERALATLYSEVESGSETRRMRVGTELRGRSGSLERLSVDLYSERKEGRSLFPSDSTMLEGRLGF